MSLVSHTELAEVVCACLEKAQRVADNHIVFNEGMRRAKSLMLANIPKCSNMGNSYGFAGWSAILSVDLRGSSKRAVRVGARDTFVTMQTYVPVMAFLVGKAEGHVVGLRGDGLVAAFGLTEGPGRPSTSVRATAVQDAITCGRAMLEAAGDHINPALEACGIEGGLRIGVGVAVGAIVVTRIGWEDANEVTAYGAPVNRACKMRADGGIILSPAAWRLLPDPTDEDEAVIYGHDEAGNVGIEFSDDERSILD